MAAEHTLKIMVEAGKASFGSGSSGLRGTNISGANGNGDTDEAERKQAQADKANFGNLKKATEMMHNTFKSNVPPLNKIFKKMGIEVGMKSILKQSQIFTGVVGSIFQILGALVDVTLAPFLPIIVPAIRKLGSLIPVWQKQMNKWAGGITDSIMWIIDKWQFVNRVISKISRFFGGSGTGTATRITQLLVAILAIMALKKGFGLLMKGMGKGLGKMVGFNVKGRGGRATVAAGENSAKILRSQMGQTGILRSMLKGMKGKKGIAAGLGLGAGLGVGLWAKFKGPKETVVDPDGKPVDVDKKPDIDKGKRPNLDKPKLGAIPIPRPMPGKVISTAAAATPPGSRTAKAFDAGMAGWTKKTQAVIADALPPAKKVVAPFIYFMEELDTHVSKPLVKVVKKSAVVVASVLNQKVFKGAADSLDDMKFKKSKVVYPDKPKIADATGTKIADAEKPKSTWMDQPEWKKLDYKSQGHMDLELKKQALMKKNITIDKLNAISGPGRPIRPDMTKTKQPLWQQLGYITEGDYRSSMNLQKGLPKDTVSAEVRRQKKWQANLDIEKGTGAKFAGTDALETIKNPLKGVVSDLASTASDFKGLTKAQQGAKVGKMLPLGLGLGFELWDAIEDFKFNTQASEDKWGEGSWQAKAVPAAGFAADLVTGIASEFDPTFVLALGAQDLSQVAVNKITGQDLSERTVAGMLYNAASPAWQDPNMLSTPDVVANLNKPDPGLDYMGGTVPALGGAALARQIEAAENKKVEVEVTITDQSKSKTQITVNDANHGLQYVGYQDGWDLEVQ